MGAQFPKLTGADYEGPDLNNAPLLEQAIAELDSVITIASAGESRDDLACLYLHKWHSLANDFGFSAQVMWHGAFPTLMVGIGEDPQHAERVRRMEAMWDHLIKSGYRFHLLRQLITTTGGAGTNPKTTADEVAHATITAMRGFLDTGGRILIDPAGNLTEGGGMPRGWGSKADFDERIMEAGRTYFAALACPRPAAQIKAFVEQFGTKTHNGWIELTSDAAIFHDPETIASAWKNAFARIEVSGEDFDNDDEDWAIICLAEDVIMTTQTAGARIAELRLWFAILGHIGNRELGLAAQRYDLETLLAAGDKLDWPGRPMALAIAALRGEVASG